MDIDAVEVKKICGFIPKNIDIYINAFVHKSLGKGINSYERLEFIGDSVVGLIVADILYEMFPNESEGFLTRVRTKIVSSKGLSMLSKELKLHNFIKMNEKAVMNKWNENPRILEDVFESFMGALYLDRGILTCKKFMKKLINKYIDMNEIVKDTNYKDILMKYLQCNKKPQAMYKISNESGPDHAKIFTIQLEIDGKKIAEGYDSIKKIAEQKAALRALTILEVVY
tara:strand:- start:123 stop:803 length:681 start_codon:yes stop_codon:yes gene_type:complete